MARGLTRLVGANALSGTLPSSVIANSTFDNITALPTAVPTGKPVLLSTATASSSASIEFTSGIDSTYDIYKFEFVNIHPSSDTTYFQFQANASGQTGFNETITSTAFRAFHFEDDSASGLGYRTTWDQAQGTGYQYLNDQIGNDADQSLNGELFVFSPSSSTYVKHFISRTCMYYNANSPIDAYIAGYFNVTTAIDEIAFKMSSGNLDSGTIKMYGISA